MSNDIELNQKNIDIELEHIFELFRNVKDCLDDDLISACKYFINYYDFDIEELPTKLCDELTYILRDEAIESQVEPFY